MYTKLIQQNTLFLKPCNALEVESRSNKISHPPGRSFSPILWIAFAEDQTLSAVPWVESCPLPKRSCWQIFSAGYSSLQLQGKGSNRGAVLPSSHLPPLTYRQEMCFVFASHPEKAHLLVPPLVLFGGI